VPLDLGEAFIVMILVSPAYQHSDPVEEAAPPSSRPKVSFLSHKSIFAPAIVLYKEEAFTRREPDGGELP
jgi:hypothetical protein